MQTNGSTTCFFQSLNIKLRLKDVIPGSVFFAVKRIMPPRGLRKLIWHIFRLLELHANWLIPALAKTFRKTRWGDDLARIASRSLDGNAYVSQAFERGATHVFVDNPAVVKNDRCILVENVLETMFALATHHRKQIDIPVEKDGSFFNTIG